MQDDMLEDDDKGDECLLWTPARNNYRDKSALLCILPHSFVNL
jgi:hypothetical protein